MKHGYYWVQMSQMNNHLSVAKLSKNGGWDYYPSEGKRSSWLKPHKVISYIEEPTNVNEDNNE